MSCTLSDLDAMVSHAVLERTSNAGKIWMLRASVLLQKGASLVLHGESAGGDVNELRLRSDDTVATYLLADWGNIDIDGVVVTSWDESTGTPDRRPEVNGRAYLLAKSRLDADGGTARESRMDIRNSYVGRLGAPDKSDVYGLAWKVVGTPSDELRVRGELVDSQAEGNWVGAYVFGGGGMEFLGNELHDSEGAGLAAKDTMGLLLVGNDIHDNRKNGVDCTQGCGGIDVRNNRAFSNVGSGFNFRRCASAAFLQDNMAYFNTEAGLALAACDGAIVRTNHFFENKRGIRLSSGSSDNLFEDNQVLANREGFYLYPGEARPDSDGRLRSNTFRGNGLFDNHRAVYLENADETQLVSNELTRSYHPDGALLLRDSLGTVLAGNFIAEDARIHTQGSSTGFATTFITQAGYAPAAISPLLIETSGRGLTTFVETSTVTHAQAGTTLFTRATPTESRAELPTLSARIYGVQHIFARPASGHVDIAPTSATTWTAGTHGPSTMTELTVGNLPPGTAHDVKKDGVVIAHVTTDSEGVLSFSDLVTTGLPFAKYALVTP